MQNNKFFRAMCFAAVALAALNVPVQGAAPKEIDAAIEKAVKYLYSKQKNGHWEKTPQPKPVPGNQVTNTLEEGNWGGLTGIATNALLSAGESPNNPKLKPAVDLLIKVPMRANVYALCQRDQVLSQLTPTPEIKKVMRLDGEYLLRAMETKGEGAGFYSYGHIGEPPRYDHSVAQYGVLAMWSCDESGFEVPNKYWPVVERAWIGHQDASGGWSYEYKGEGHRGVVNASMTAAGVATLFITQDYVHSDEGLTPKGNITNPAIEKGLKWLGENFKGVFSLANETQIYALYGLERCGVASGYKYFGKHNWYQEGADWLLKKQNNDGSWGSTSDMWDHNVNKVPTTAFAIMFLTRGREPVFMNKLSYKVQVGGKAEVGHWNQRPRDVANVARWVGKQAERTLNWQIVSLADTPVEEFHDSPILYIAGDQPLEFTPEEDAKLRKFVQEGGLIFGNPDGNSPQQFTKAFGKLGGRLFPDYEMRPLPATHPIYTSEQFRGPQISKRPILALSNGVRELMICPTVDFAHSWQSRAYATEEAFRNTANIYLYVTGGKGLRKKGETHIVQRDKSIQPAKNVKLARLNYGGNSDPEPAGWARLAAMMHNEDKLKLDVETVKLGENKLGGFKLAHMTGTSAVTLSEGQRKEVLQFVKDGGTLLIDAAGGQKAFADAMEKELGAMFPENASDVIPANDPLFQDAGPALTFDIRTWALKERLAKSGPQLRGVKQQNRYVVLLSREDFSNGLVGQPCDGVIGYTPDAATALVRQVIKSLTK